MRRVRLLIENETRNGSVLFTPDDGGITTVTVGINGEWSRVVSVLLHELYEAVLIDLNTRYGKDPSYTVEASDFMFLVSHNQLSEAHERVGEVISIIYPYFYKAYKKYSPYKKG